MAGTIIPCRMCGTDMEITTAFEDVRHGEKGNYHYKKHYVLQAKCSKCGDSWGQAIIYPDGGGLVRLEDRDEQ